MIKNTIHKFVKSANGKFRASAFEKRMALKEQVIQEHSGRSYNPRSARNRSLKGIAFTSK